MRSHLRKLCGCAACCVMCALPDARMNFAPCCSHGVAWPSQAYLHVGTMSVLPESLCAHMHGAHAYGYRPYVVPGMVACFAQEKRLKLVDDCTSVLVRVLDEQRPGLATAPAWAVPEADRAVPEYARAAADKLNKPLGRAAKVLRRAVPGGMTDAQFVHDLNAATLRLAGLQDGPGDSAAGYGDGSMAVA